MATKKKAAHAKDRGGQCDRVRILIRQGKTNQQVWDVVHKEFPKSRLGINGVSWHRNELRLRGEKVKTNREIVAARSKPSRKAA
jgi:hypothetical protein